MIRGKILKRDNYMCVWIREDTGEMCGAYANQVDHKDDPDNHRHTNLQSLCSYHHKVKTAGQGGEANANKRKRTSREAIPGIVYLD
jgi:5-methylcytosine-specific restriction enzyme A